MGHAVIARFGKFSFRPHCLICKIQLISSKSHQPTIQNSCTPSSGVYESPQCPGKVLPPKGAGTCGNEMPNSLSTHLISKSGCKKPNFSVIGTLFLITQLIIGKRKTLKSTNIANKLQNHLSRVLNLIKEMKSDEC